MSSLSLTRFSKEPSFLNIAQSFKFLQSRSFIDPRKHFEPEDQKWQWEVRDDPVIHYPDPCLSKTCPKPTFFPKFKKRYVPKDIESCKRVEQPMSWKEYFSYLLPEKMQKPRPPVNSCKKMMDLKRRLCSDPRIPVCRLPPLPTEWDGMGVVKECVSYCQPPPKSVLHKPCPPPAHILPRCLLVKKGVCVSKGKVPPCLEAYAVQFPNKELLMARRKAAMEAPRPFAFKCDKTCYPKIPPVDDKTSRLSCRHCAEYKRVECPKQLYTRYKSVEVPKPCLCVGAQVPALKPKPATSASCSTRQIHTESEFSISVQPSKSPIELRKFILPFKESTVEPSSEGLSFKNRIRNPSVKNESNRSIMTPTEREFKGDTGGSKRPHLNQALDKSFQSFSRVFGRLEMKFEESGKRGIATGVPRPGRDKCGKEDETKKEQICSGCAGIKAAEEEDENRVKPPINCKMRAAGTCPGPKKEKGPDDPPISNPYWDNKGVYLSPCNQPREPVCPKPPPPPMPCDENKNKRKFHTSAVVLPLVDTKKGSVKLNDWIMWSNEEKEDTCDDKEKKDVETLKEGEGNKPLEVKDEGHKEDQEIDFPKFDPHNVERASCYPKIPKKEKEKSNRVKTKGQAQNSGLICKVAGVLHVGCGKKECRK